MNLDRWNGVVLYRCETRSLAVWEGHRLRMRENRDMKKIYGLKEEVRDGLDIIMIRNFTIGML
jgi:hypothetical protein